MITGLPLLALLACNHPYPHGGEELPSCDEVTYALDEQAPPVSPDELAALVAAFAPTAVTWDEYSSDGTTSATVSLTVTLDEASAATVVYDDTDATGWCTPGPVLREVATLAVVVGDGAVGSTIPATFEASAATSDAVTFEASGYDHGTFQPITVDAAWQAACADGEPEEWGGAIDDFYVDAGGTLAAARLGIGGYREGRDDTVMGTCWSGTLALGHDTGA